MAETRWRNSDWAPKPRESAPNRVFPPELFCDTASRPYNASRFGRHLSPDAVSGRMFAVPEKVRHTLFGVFTTLPMRSGGEPSPGRVH